MPPCHGGDRRFESGRARQNKCPSWRVGVFIRKASLRACLGIKTSSRRERTGFMQQTFTEFRSSDEDLNLRRFTAQTSSLNVSGLTSLNKLCPDDCQCSTTSGLCCLFLALISSCFTLLSFLASFVFLN